MKSYSDFIAQKIEKVQFFCLTLTILLPSELFPGHWRNPFPFSSPCFVCKRSALCPAWCSTELSQWLCPQVCLSPVPTALLLTFSSFPFVCRRPSRDFLTGMETLTISQGRWNSQWVRSLPAQVNSTCPRGALPKQGPRGKPLPPSCPGPVPTLAFHVSLPPFPSPFFFLHSSLSLSLSPSPSICPSVPLPLSVPLSFPPTPSPSLSSYPILSLHSAMTPPPLLPQWEGLGHLGVPGVPVLSRVH